MKVGRNDPCPCYSGKKHKKCCLNKKKEIKIEIDPEISLAIVRRELLRQGIIK